ncbi:hypothetical protein TNCV_4954681 [Trichonephila clavipes]|nr:hypothetical protein TNCV_4954681 [Trichonephila clavipes]
MVPSQSTSEEAKLSCVESELKPTQKHPTTASFESFRWTDDSDDICHGEGYFLRWRDSVAIQQFSLREFALNKTVKKLQALALNSHWERERPRGRNGDHAPANSTTPRIIMSDSSDNMEFSPTKSDQISACEKLRDTVTGISTLHKSIYGMDGRSPSPRNSFTDLYISSTQAMIRRKEEMPNKKKLCKKRKQKSKESTEEFIFPKKTARPISPTLTQDSIETNNSFSDLEQDVEHPPDCKSNYRGGYT